MTFRMPWYTCMAVAALLGCREERVFYVSLSFRVDPGPSTDILFVGDTATLRARAFARGWPTSLREDSDSGAARRFRWTSSDTTVALVGPAGAVEARSPGTAELRAQIDGVVSDALVLRVTPRAATLGLDPLVTRARVGDTIIFRLSARDPAGSPVVGAIVGVSVRGLALVSIESPYNLVTPATLHFPATSSGDAEVLATAYHVRAGQAIRSDTARVNVVAH